MSDEAIHLLAEKIRNSNPATTDPYDLYGWIANAIDLLNELYEDPPMNDVTPYEHAFPARHGSPHHPIRGEVAMFSKQTFGHDQEIGRLFEEYDRLVRWEEHNSRLDATDPVLERAAMRGRIVAYIANTATLQQDAHTSPSESTEGHPRSTESAPEEGSDE